MRRIQELLAGLVPAILVGCAHPINVEPDHGRIESTSVQPVPIKIGWLLRSDLVNLE